MNNNINKISKVEIKSLWNRFDLTWNLQPDVNILSGINGSGKSTILNCIASLALKGYVPDRTSELIKSVEILFNNGVALLFVQILVFEQLEQVFEQIKGTQEFSRMLLLLPEKYKRILIMRYYKDLSYQEIAHEEDIPLGTVKAQLFRAKELLFELVQQSTESR